MFDSLTTTVANQRDSIQLESLQAGLTYYFQLKSTKSDSSEAITSTISSFQTTKTALRITTGPSIFNITDSTANIRWESNLLSVATVFFGVDSNSFDSISTSIASLSDTVLIEQLAAGTKYFYQLRLKKNGESETFLSSIGSFTTTAPSNIPTVGLIISEYVEGSSNNKVIEIYNGTDSIIDLKNYAIALISNGRDTIGNNLIFDSSMDLAVGATYVIANPSSSAEILALADTTSSVTFFNGDDDIAIMTRDNFENRTLQFIDYFGQRSVDPGSYYEGGGVKTQNQTLRRKTAILQGDTNDSDVFDPSEEWDQFDIDEITGLGERNTVIPISFLSLPTASSIGLDSAIISFQSSDSATALIRYGVSTNYTDSVLINIVQTSFSYVIDSLVAGQEYHYNVTITRASDLNAITSSDANFITKSLNLIYNELPSAREITDSTALISWSTNFNSNSVVFYGTDSLSFDSLSTPSAAIADSITLNSLAAGVNYFYKVRSTREGSTETIVSSVDSFQTTKTALTITAGPTVFNITDSTANIRWESNFLSIATVFFGTDSNSFDSVTTSIARFTDTLVFEPLTLGAEYFFKLKLTKSGSDEVVYSELSSFRTSSPTTFPQLGLFISEYIEGSSNNKAIEIYNGTNATIDLRNYAIVLISNGRDTIGNNLTFDSKKELAIGETYVIANGRANAEILDLADTTSTITFFNGDDDLAIMTRANFDTRTLEFIDYFGQRSVDPGSFYEGGGVKTQNQTLRRKASVIQGDRNDTDQFDPSIEWDQFDINDISDLGKHNSSNVFTFSTSPSISNISAKSASISFETNDSATAVVYYGKTISYTDSIIFADLRISFNSLILGLDAGTEYHVLVKAIQDSTNEVIVSNPLTFTTLDTGIVNEILFPGLYGQPLMIALRDSFKSHTDLGYNNARDQMFGFVDNYNDTVYLAYTGFPFEHNSGTGRPNTGATNVNTEHTWPQSKGASGIRRSDIHHLFGTFVSPNSARGSNPFDDINDDQTEKWWISNTAITTKPTININRYSESTNSKFEPREVHKGNTARAMFYFYTMYQNDGIDTTWFKPQIEKLKEWHLNDPADAREIVRNTRIKQVQGNENPFIIDASLVERILSSQPPEFNFSVNPTAKNITDSSATISFVTNSLATAKIRYGVSTNYTDSIIVNSAKTSFNIELNSLMAITDYHYKIIITKFASTIEKESADLTFITNPSSGNNLTLTHESFHYPTEYSLSNVVRFNIGFSSELKEILQSKVIFRTDTSNDTSSIAFLPVYGNALYQANFKASSSGELEFFLTVRDQLDKISSFKSKNLLILSGKSKYKLKQATFTNLYQNSFTYIQSNIASPFNDLQALSDKFTVVVNGSKSLKMNYKFDSNIYSEDFKVGLYRFDPIANVWKFYKGQGKNTELKTIVEKNGIYQVFYNPSKEYQPETFMLYQNSPNPFNPITTIPFDLKENTFVQLVVYNIIGQKIKTILNKNMKIGSYKMNWDARNDLGEKVSSGVYFYQLKLKNRTFSRKMILIK